MLDADNLASILLEQWRSIRGMTYDYLAVLQPSDLALRLPFPESQALVDQFWCMLGAQESYLRELRAGTWQGFSCSLDDGEDYSREAIERQMRAADQEMVALLSEIDLHASLANDKRGYHVVQRLVEHEMHHQGQLINFMFYGHLPIPDSWHAKWALAREGEEQGSEQT
jgi:hypothetical protein